MRMVTMAGMSPGKGAAMPAFRASIALESEFSEDTKAGASSTRRYKSPLMNTMRVEVAVPVLVVVAVKDVPVIVDVMTLVVVTVSVVDIDVIVVVVVVMRHRGKLPSRLPDLLQFMTVENPE